MDEWMVLRKECCEREFAFEAQDLLLLSPLTASASAPISLLLGVVQFAAGLLLLQLISQVRKADILSLDSRIMKKHDTLLVTIVFIQFLYHQLSMAHLDGHNQETYTDQFTLEVTGGPDAARKIASDHGFTYLAQVRVVDPFVFFSTFFLFVSCSSVNLTPTVDSVIHLSHE